MECGAGVPSEEVEDGRNLGRELRALKGERTMHINRIKGLLIQQGVVIKRPSSKKLKKAVPYYCVYRVNGKQKWIF